MTLPEFRALFPEFRATADEVISAHLDKASEELDSAIYRDKYDAAHGWLTAHILSASPYGKTARLDDDKGEDTTYWRNYARIRRQVAPRQIVT